MNHIKVISNVIQIDNSKIKTQENGVKVIYISH